MSRDACFEIVISDSQQVRIRDTGDHATVLTVTNDAENVVTKLHGLGRLGARRLFYQDSMGMWDELRHDGAGTFLGFGPAR